MLQKLLIISKNTSNESCAESNFLQKTQWEQIFVFPRSGDTISANLLNLIVTINLRGRVGFSITFPILVRSFLHCNIPGTSPANG